MQFGGGLMAISEKQKQAVATFAKVAKISSRADWAEYSISFIAGAQLGMAIFMWFVPGTELIPAVVIFTLSIVAYLTACLLKCRWRKQEDELRDKAIQLVNQSLDYEEGYNAD